MKNDWTKRYEVDGEFKATFKYGVGGEPAEETLDVSKLFLVADDHDRLFDIGASDSKIANWVNVSVRTPPSEKKRDVEIHYTTGFKGRFGESGNLSAVTGTVKGYVNGPGFASCDSFSFSGQTDLLQNFTVEGCFNLVKK